MKVSICCSVLFVLIFSFTTIVAQTKGKYIPTKYDSVKKKIPQQVYGNKLITPAAPKVDTPPQEEKGPIQEEKRTEKLEPELKEKESEEPIPKEKKSAPPPIIIQKKEIKTSITPPTAESDIPSNDRARPSVGSKWTLQQCIQYAMDNNLQVAEAELNERMTNLLLSQNKYSRLPNVNGDASVGESYGRSIDPTTNQFVTKGFLYNNLGLNSQTLLFGWFQKQYSIQQNEMDVRAANAASLQLKDDIALNVATGFLRVLLAREQVRIVEAQLKLNNEQYNQTVKYADAGKLPELNVAQMLSQLSSDTASLVGAQADERIALLQLRALLNFNYRDPFDIQAPDINIAELSSLYALPSPEMMFDMSIKNQHQMKVNQWKLLSANKTLAIAKASQYPQLSLFANLGTNFSSVTKDITGQTYIGDVPIGFLKIGSTEYALNRPDYSFTTRTRPVGQQYADNLRANIGLSLSIPIFNGFSAGTNIQKARIGLVSQKIASDNDKQKLKQNIYKAYEEAKASAQKYNAAKRAKEAADRALDFAVKRFAAGMISTFEYSSTLTSAFNASSSVLSSKYDLLFKLKVLDYYMGNPIKL
jgi:outer membrane protein